MKRMVMPAAQAAVDGGMNCRATASAVAVAGGGLAADADNPCRAGVRGTSNVV